MKITFSNLGAIKKTTLDLRPLTIIIGPNNSNKTYIAYSIYGLLQSMRLSNTNLLQYIEEEPDSEDSYSLKLDSKFYSRVKEGSRESVSQFRNNLTSFFQDSSRKIFSKTNFEITTLNKELINKIDNAFDGNKTVISNKFDIKLDIGAKKIYFNAEEFRNNIKKGHYDSDQAYFGIGAYLQDLMFSKPFLLPAERNALIISYKILENRRYELMKIVSRKNFSQNNLSYPFHLFGGESNSLQDDSWDLEPSVNYPQPIEDFLRFLTNLELENPLEKGDFAEFAENIERNLQKGDKTNYISRELGGREVKINVKKDLDIDLYNASSSIKQLAPLLLYLRYRAKKGDLLIIDEPEMNLHPESQAKLLEVLAMLVNAGVNVLLTTHSPYFMSHLNNLISGDMNNENVREKQATSLYLEDSRAFLKPEDVSAYEMKNNKLVSLKHKDEDGDYSISWETLSDVSADIQQKFFEMYEKRETTSSGEEKE